MDNIRQSLEYQQGYSEGFREGFNQAMEKYRKLLVEKHLSEPIKVIVTTKEYENLRKGNK